MGAVFRSKDLSEKHRRIIINDAIRDLSPNTKESVLDILEQWKEDESERRLDDILGMDERKKLINRIIDRSNQLKGDKE
ncbi:MAG: hypothetical protein H0X50_07875 [Nitrosopumilus sp.]|nr:hypothetical protein [Nitrosopumilus sp.]